MRVPRDAEAPRERGLGTESRKCCLSESETALILLQAVVDMALQIPPKP